MKDYFEMPYCNRAGIVIPAFLFAMAGVCLGFAATGYYSVRILVLAAVLFSAAGIAVSGRFRMTRFYYQIDSTPLHDGRETAVSAHHAGKLYLHIVQTAFNRSRPILTVCADDILCVEEGKLTRRDRRAYRKQNIRLRAGNYCTNLFSPYCAKVYIKDGEGVFCAVVEADEIFLQSLRDMKE